MYPNHQIAIIKKTNVETNAEKESRFRWAELGRNGYASGGGIWHSSPLK